MNLNLSNHNEIVKCLGWLAGSARIGYECLPMTKRWLICFYFEFLWNNLRKASESNLFSHRICRNSFSVLLKLSLQVGLANLIGGGGEMKNYSGEKLMQIFIYFPCFSSSTSNRLNDEGVCFQNYLAESSKAFALGRKLLRKGHSIQLITINNTRGHWKVCKFKRFELSIRRCLVTAFTGNIKFLIALN